MFGSPDVMVTRGVSETLSVTGDLAAAIVAAVKSKSTASGIKSAIDAAAKRFGTGKLARPIERELMHGAMLGALDSSFEAERGVAIAPESFAALHARLVTFAGTDKGFAARPLAEAIKRFLDKKAVTRETFDEMTAAAKRRAFTVANAANEEMVRTVKRELVRQLAVGADLKDFGRHAAARFESAGWTPANPSHVETVFRTNVLGAYNGGRARQMTEPLTLQLRPFWESMGVNDPPRQRSTHAKMSGVVLRASDPFWQEAYPPYGYNCRCRTRSLSLKQGAGRVQEGTRFSSILPDPGFASGIGRVLDGAAPDLKPANDTVPPEPANDT